MKDKKPIDAPKNYRMKGMDDLIEVIASYNNTANALGYSVFYYAKKMYAVPGLRLMSIDNIDPNDPDGSYDMCLSRPETVRSLCKVQIDPCEAAEPKILDYVYARLASMRVDSCTKEVKACLTDDNRCGKDYSNCIGLDLMAIRDMCPLEKLVGCQQNGQAATWNVIDNIVQGIYLNIDNSMLTTCTNLVNEKMLEICEKAQKSCTFASTNLRLWRNW